VWHDDGGVLYSEQNGVGNMCKQCHKDKRVRGAMGEEGIDLECVDCHMPEASMKGAGASHLFRINTTALAAKDNTHTDADSGTKTWWNTDPNGDAFLTLDLLCTKCHAKSMTLAQMATAAKAIHRQPGLVDLTVNNGDGLQLVKKTDTVSVDFSVVVPDSLKGPPPVKADWWVICQGPKGWTSWNGKKWTAGLRPWRKGVALADVPKQNVLTGKLAPGYYTYWVSIAPTDGTVNFDGVLVYVTK
jgi:hypothetical protein